MMYKAQISQCKQKLNAYHTHALEFTEIRALENEISSVLTEIYNKTSIDELLALAEVFILLANVRFKMGEATTNLQFYNDAAIRIQYAKKILAHSNLAECEIAREQVATLTTSSETMLINIHDVIVGRSDHRTESLDDDFIHTPLIESLRLAVHKFVRTNHSPAKPMFHKITEEMKQYLAALFCDAEAVLGRAPCEYSVIGLGSMALGQITPYSDLEFAILTANDSYQGSSDPKIKNYFINLTHYVHFKVILLGETTIPTNVYSLDLSCLLKKGIRFDSGEKTPLVGIDHDKPYQLIQTIDQMFQYVRNEDNQIEQIDNNLPYIVEQTCFVYGAPSLADQYQALVREFLLSTTEDSGIKNSSSRAVRRLSVEVTEKDFGQEYRVGVKVFSGNLEQFGILSAEELFGKLFNVKQEVYRLADRFIYNLGLICGVVGAESGWDIIEQLKEKGFITKSASVKLNEALSFATIIRLRAYDYYGFQAEEMDIRGDSISSYESNQLATRFRLLKKELKEDGGLFKYYYTVLPLIAKLKEYCDHFPVAEQGTKNFLKQESFYHIDKTNKAQIHLRLLNCDVALQYLEEVLLLEQSSLQPNLSKMVSIVNILGVLANYQGKYDIALLKHQEALVLIKKLHGEHHQEVAQSLNNIGSVYNILGHLDEALQHYNEALVIRQKIYGDHHSIVASTLNNIGTIYNKLGLYDLALAKYEEALSIWQSVYSTTHPDIASAQNNIGYIHYSKGDYVKALSHYELALRIRQEIYGNNHPVVAASLNNIGSVEYKLGNYGEALKQHTMALAIWQDVYAAFHPDVARSLNNIGNVYNKQGLYSEALKKYEEALVVKKGLYGNIHQEIVTALNNIANMYDNMEQFSEALTFYQEAMAVLKALPSDNAISLATILNNIGNVYNKQGLYSEAETHYLDSLVIKKEIFGEEHAEVATTLNNMGSMYANQKKYPAALDCFEQSLSIRREIYGDKHLLISESVNNLGYTYYALSIYESALVCFKEVLAINREFFSDAHPEILSNLHFIENLEEKLARYNLRSVKRARDADSIDETSEQPNKKKVVTEWRDESQSSLLEDSEASYTMILGDNYELHFG